MRVADPLHWRNLKTWITVKISNDSALRYDDEIHLWAKKNGTNKLYCRVWDEYHFEDEQDAVLFALKWS